MSNVSVLVKFRALLKGAAVSLPFGRGDNDGRTHKYPISVFCFGSSIPFTMDATYVVHIPFGRRTTGCDNIESIFFMSCYWTQVKLYCKINIV